MMGFRHLIPLLLPWLAAAGPLPENVDLLAGTGDVANANHIFNSIHDSMRQFGSSLNHNGMGIFVATVPGGTELYHGTSIKDRFNGTQWLAFEPEHAMIFARPRGPPPGHRPGQGPPEDGHDGYGPPPGYGPSGYNYHDNDDDDQKHHAHDDDQRNKKYPGGKASPDNHHGTHARPCKKGKHDRDQKHAWNDHPEGYHDPSYNGSRPGVPHHPPPYHGAPPEGEHRGPPPPGSGHRGPPCEGSEHHEPPRAAFKGFPAHDSKDTVSRDHPKDHGHHKEHRILSLPPMGFWVRRLGDMLRNPKRSASPLDSLQSEPRAILDKQEPLAEDQLRKDGSGYLHTYRTKHDLRLLYVDGQSAAKSTKGTLDTQDILLLNGKLGDGSHDMSGEKQRAVEMCNIAHEQWGNHIDGILRMEGGFEIILCSFADHLDVVSISQTQPKASGGPGRSNEDDFNYYRAVAARYFGIGGGRVVLNYENFVTAFAHPKAMYFDETNRPRLHNGSEELAAVRKLIDKIAVNKGDDASTFNWQIITDMIVERYADRIEYLTTGRIDNLEGLKSELDRALRPFIDYSARNATREAERCASQFYPQDVDTTTVAARAVKQLSQSLCFGLVDASGKNTYEETLTSVQELRDYLGWTTWKRCRGCTVNELCFLPIWPIGSAEDFEQPRCRSDASMPSRDNYWGGFGGPPRGGRDGKHDEKKLE